MNPDGDQYDKSPVPYAALTGNAIENAIDSACLRASSEFTDGSMDPKSEGRWVWNRLDTEDQQNGGWVQLLYGFMGSKETITHESNKVIVTFYFAYSTWDGRILYIDNWSDSVQRVAVIAFTVYLILADIAVQLHCRRLSWQHTLETAVQFPCLVQPETMQGWLTLHWDKDSMVIFASQSSFGTTESHDAYSSVTDNKPMGRSFREVIENSLLQYAYMTSECAPKKIRRLRLANSNDDIEAICRLVQGLADFEKEPDAVKVSPGHYQVDGGFQSSSEQPLFYCILLESWISNASVTSERWYACGMAFFWIGAKRPRCPSLSLGDQINQEEKLFLYLEDLFIEEEYRGDGAGTCMMHALSNVTQSLSCHRMVWQALDWNTPALTFYQEKIGAYIVEGLLSTRFANSCLDEFYALARKKSNDTSTRI